MSRKRKPADAGDPSSSSPTSPPALRVQPLFCPACQGAVPLGDGDSTPCPYCGKPVPIPPEHQALRAAQRAHASDLAMANQRYERIGAPPGPLLRAWAGAAGGVLGVLLALVKGFVWIWVGLLRLVFEILGSIDDLRVLLAVLLLPLGALYGILWLTAKGLHRLAPLFGFDLVDVLSLGGAFLALGLLLYLLFAVPLALHGYAESFARVRRRLQACLAARPPRTSGGPALCRSCGAALVVPQGALGVRCAYCEADNLVALSQRWVSNVKGAAKNLHHQVSSALEEERRTRARASRAAWTIVLLGLLLPILVWVLGWTMGHFDLFEHRDGWRAAMAAETRTWQAHVCPTTTSASKCKDGWDLPLRRGEVVTFKLTGAAPRSIVARRMGSRKPIGLDWQEEPGSHATGSFKARVSGWYVIETPTVQLSFAVAPPGASPSREAPGAATP